MVADLLCAFGLVRGREGLHARSEALFTVLEYSGLGSYISLAVVGLKVKLTLINRLLYICFT